MSRKLVISIGGRANLAAITKVTRATWDQLAKYLSRPPLGTKDKSAAGWYCPAEFMDSRRHGDTLLFRHALTFDYDQITPTDLAQLKEAYAGFAYLLYTTASHTRKEPRVRLVLPLTRPASAYEFSCVTRTIGATFDLDKLAKESDKPAQMMFLPTKRPTGTFWAEQNHGAWVDVDAILGGYDDWKNKTSWPARSNENLHDYEGIPDPPDTKPGIVGDFCRTYRIPEAIDRFELPYSEGSTEDRYSYIAGSRPDGLRIYDDGLKAHSDHDTDPAHGQTNAFDLVRLHKFRELDKEGDFEKSITERPSYLAMTRFAMEQPEIQQTMISNEFEDLDKHEPKEKRSLAVPLERLLKNPTKPRWLLRDRLERAVIALMAGPRGSYKSFVALDWAMQTVMQQDGPVYVLSAEGMDFDRRAKAWLRVFAPDWPEDKHTGLYVAQMRIDLNQHDNIELVRQDCVKNHGIRPVLFVLDTFSKLSGALDENSNTDVKAFIGRLDNGLKRAFDATVLLITHTGHGEKTRARGASALEADTDAVYVVSRHESSNLISLTRERFKSSPELPPLVLQPEIIPLGYVDDDGELVTSIVLHPSDKPALTSRAEPRGLYPKHVMQTAREILRHEPVPVEKLVAESASRLTPPEGRDTRRQNAARAVQSLVADGFLHKQTDGKISLTTAVTADEDWDDG